MVPLAVGAKPGTISELTTRFPGALKVAGARLVDSKRPSPNVVINLRRRRTRAAGILFRNAISRATVTEHAIARAMEQQYARSLAGRFCMVHLDCDRIPPRWPGDQRQNLWRRRRSLVCVILQNPLQNASEY